MAFGRGRARRRRPSALRLPSSASRPASTSSRCARCPAGRVELTLVAHPPRGVPGVARRMRPRDAARNATRELERFRESCDAEPLEPKPLATSLPKRFRRTRDQATPRLQPVTVWASAIASSSARCVPFHESVVSNVSSSACAPRAPAAAVDGDRRDAEAHRDSSRRSSPRRATPGSPSASRDRHGRLHDRRVAGVAAGRAVADELLVDGQRAAAPARVLVSHGVVHGRVELRVERLQRRRRRPSACPPPSTPRTGSSSPRCRRRCGRR